MKNSILYIKNITKNAILKLYGLNNIELDIEYIIKKFSEDITIVIFPLVKKTSKNLETIGNEIGFYLKNNTDFLDSYKIIRGFLNCKLTNIFYIKNFEYLNKNIFLKKEKKNNKSIMIEFSSPNTNKPLHIGHIRNILLGNSISYLFKYIGKNVIKVQIFNDRGIHICKSMVAWNKFGNNNIPEYTKIKSDHFVGIYYIKFYKEWNKEIKILCDKGIEYNKAKEKANIMICARNMLKKWESKNIKTISLWKKMNNWVYDGFIKTYKRLGINFDINQYESKTYILGKKIVEKGLKKNIFYKKKDGSIWIDLKDEGLGEKLLLRSDGTSVYITQDLGTVIERFKNYDIDTLIYVVGKEQDYHFKVLFSILKKLKYSFVKKIFHLSYEMVFLPSGKIQSRYGSVVYADDLMDKMYNISSNICLEKNKINIKNNKNILYETIAQGALKYHFLKIDPNKKIIFDPKKSLDFKGNTGTYIQYTYVRICSIKRNNNTINNDSDYTINSSINVNRYERIIIYIIEEFYENIQNSVKNLNPSLIANYAYELAKSFNDYYHNIIILNIKNKHYKNFRFKLTLLTGTILKKCMNILGISLTDYM